MKFISKAQNLKNLQGVLQSAKVLPLLIFTKKEVLENMQSVLDEIANFRKNTLIIRSSSKDEDNLKSSNAGAFLSMANVDSSDIEKLTLSLKQVANSMPNLSDEILVQEMLENVEMCGVAFSVDKDSFAPYFCIEYDKSGATDSITDGSAQKRVSFYAHRDCENVELSGIIALIKELEVIFDYPFLDIEFAIMKNEIYCLQVRPLVKSKEADCFCAIEKKDLERFSKRFVNLQKEKIGIHGKKAIFGVMPDWNPAEIIGLKPKRLALSLYKEIITDSTWAFQRDNYGYLALRSYPLMYSFLGIPYIDVRVSFNSFIPKSLDENIAKKLVEFYLQKLEKNANLHDKIEFEIVFSCYDLDLENRLKELLEHGFSESEILKIKESLRSLTNSIIAQNEGLYLKDLQKIDKLREIHKDIEKSNFLEIDRLYWLIENCKRYGTLPFAGIARAGFIAVSLLNSLVKIGFFSESEKSDFLLSLNTVSKRLSHFTKNLNAKNKEEFLREFGHLRAGTYDILSPRYDKAFSEYFSFSQNRIDEKNNTFVLSKERMNALESLLKKHQLEINAKGFLDFLKVAIEGRERAKFEFTRLLSSALEEVAKLGEHYKITREEMAYVDIKSILDLHSSLYFDNPKKRFLEEIARNKKEHKKALAVKLPPLLCDKSEVFSFFSLQDLPNFITQKRVVADVIKERVRNNVEGKTSSVEGKIVLIESADPGYDYLFTKNIIGLITCYGGANSHMAIRASEIGLPSAIGVGVESFVKYTKAQKIILDCESKQILCL